MNEELTSEEAVDVVINGLRTLKLAQVRKQLEADIADNPDRFMAVTAFVIDARTQE